MEEVLKGMGGTVVVVEGESEGPSLADGDAGASGGVEGLGVANGEEAESLWAPSSVSSTTCTAL